MGGSVLPGYRGGVPDELRQLAVERLMLVGTPPEERFDRLTRLAQKAFGVPVAAITLVDQDRVWAKSCAGIPAGDLQRSESFCMRTVALERLLVVEDARREGRFAGLPAVTGEPGFRFYAGVPIADPDGIAIGTFCLLALEPRTLDARDRELLAELAAWAREEMTCSADTRRAREVQQRMMPAHPPGLDPTRPGRRRDARRDGRIRPRSAAHPRPGLPAGRLDQHLDPHLPPRRRAPRRVGLFRCWSEA